MTEVMITYRGAGPHAGVADVYHFSPLFQAKLGELQVTYTRVQLSGFAAKLAKDRAVADPDAVNSLLEDALLRYGVRQLEASLDDVVAADGLPPESIHTVMLGVEDLSQLLELVQHKSCEYQTRDRRDYYCLTPSSSDGTARLVMDGRRAAPTSLPLCERCELPSTDYLCSSLSHPEVIAIEVMEGIVARQLGRAFCNDGQPGIRQPHLCRPGGNDCWKRTVVLEPSQPAAAATDLPDAIDTLSAYWRLAFHKTHRLVTLHTVSSAAALAQACSSREDFESRISSLTDLLDKFKIDDDLLPDGLSDEERKGSMNRLESCIKHKLPTEYRELMLREVRTLRNVRRARVAVQHTGGGRDSLPEALRRLGIYDAPPNWSGAWERVRAVTADALNVIRRQLMYWIDGKDE